MPASLRIGETQRAALITYVLEEIHEPVGMRLDGARFIVEGDLMEAGQTVMDAANSCDESGDAEWRDALGAVASRLWRLAYSEINRKINLDV